MRHTILLFLLLVCSVPAWAQWSVELSHTLTYTTISRSDARRVDEIYSGLWNNGAGAWAEYGFQGPVFVKTGLVFTTRSYRMDRVDQAVDFSYYERKNTYLLLPVLCGAKTQLGKMQLKTMAGGFCGYWLKARRKGTMIVGILDSFYPHPYESNVGFNRENRRFNAGIAGGVGLSVPVGKNFGLEADALYYYDLVSHNKGYKNLPDNRYFNSLTFNTGITYSF